MVGLYHQRAGQETSHEDPYMHNTKQTWDPYAEDDLDSSPAPAHPDDAPMPADD